MEKGESEEYSSLACLWLDMPAGCTSLDILTASLGATVRHPSFSSSRVRCSRADARESARPRPRTLAHSISTLSGDLN